MTFQTNVYGVIHKKTPRECVLLNTVGGCSWRRCAFCEYSNTFSRTAFEADRNNRQVLSQVQGIYDTLQVMCSASFAELPTATWYNLREICSEKGISRLLIEQHWMFRDQNDRIRQFFAGIDVDITFGIETFDFTRRETEWFKGYGRVTVEELKAVADSVNLLIGVSGQTMQDIAQDLDIALTHFKRVNVCVFEPNDTLVERDWDLVEQFYNSDLFQRYRDDSRVEILDGLDRRAPDNLGFVGVGPQYK